MLISFANATCLFYDWWCELRIFLTRDCHIPEARVALLREVIARKRLSAVAYVSDDTLPARYFGYVVFFAEHRMCNGNMCRTIYGIAVPPSSQVFPSEMAVLHSLTELKDYAVGDSLYIAENLCFSNSEAHFIAATDSNNIAGGT